MAQYKSELVVELVMIKSPVAVTISASRILSTPKPLPGAKGPWPPPIDQPMTPTVEAQPEDMNLLLSAAALCASLNTIPAPN